MNKICIDAWLLIFRHFDLRDWVTLSNINKYCRLLVFENEINMQWTEDGLYLLVKHKNASLVMQIINKNWLKYLHLTSTFQTACLYGNTRLVELLLKNEKVDPGTNDNYAIGIASQRGHLEIVKLLLPHPKVKPQANNNYAINQAAIYEFDDIFQLLQQDKRVDRTGNEFCLTRGKKENGFQPQQDEKKQKLQYSHFEKFTKNSNTQ